MSRAHSWLPAVSSGRARVSVWCTVGSDISRACCDAHSLLGLQHQLSPNCATELAQVKSALAQAWRAEAVSPRRHRHACGEGGQPATLGQASAGSSLWRRPGLQTTV